ncbi:MAG: translocase [Acidobacteria bacterium]|nr:translocase [Acidobacteriota bacterium]
MTANRTKGGLDRALSLFTDVKAGEGATALLLAFNIFSVLACYYVLKTVRESLILTEGGAEVKSYTAAGQALLLVAFVPAYGWLASRVSRVRLINGVTLFFASHLVIFYVLGAAGVHIGVAFFLWLGIFSLVVPAQVWAFANDLYDSERGKRLFPLVGLGMSLGAWVGSTAASALFAGLGPYRLLLVSAAGIALCPLLTVWIERREEGRTRAAGAAASVAPVGKAGGFQLVLSQRYLLLIALLVMVLNVVNTVGEFILGKLVVEHTATAVAAGTAGGLDQAALIGTFYGDFYSWVNLVGFLFQLLLVSKIFKYIGVRGALFILPVVALFSYGMLAFLPVLAIVRVAKIVENSTDYSIQNTARQALFLPTSREAKYKAKQAIDSFFWRAGDLLQAVIVFVGASLAFGIRGFAAINLILVAVWFALVVGIVREHRKMTPIDTTETAAAA